MGNEFHEPYFSTIKKLLGLEKLVEKSFIAQSLPFRHECIKKFTKSIEDRHEEPWARAIMKCSQLNNISGFSEYESIGNFALKNFSEGMIVNNGKWERRETQLFKSKNLSFNFLDLFASANPTLNFISFEGWTA